MFFIFTTVQIYISFPLELVIKNRIISLQEPEGSWMVAESKRRLATINIFSDIVVSLLTAKNMFWRLRLCHFISATKIATDKYPTFTRHPDHINTLCL